MKPPCTLEQIAPRIYWLTPDQRTDRPSLGAVVGKSSTLLIDAGASPAHTALFLDLLSKAGVRPPRYASLTHWHWDHCFGASALNGLPLIAHTETARQLRVQAGYAWEDEALDQRVADGLEIAFCRDMLKLELPDRSGLFIVPPDVLFDFSLTLDLGDLTCHLVHVGGDHSADSCVAYIPEEQVVFLGDCHYPNIHNEPNFFMPERVFPLMERLLGFDADVYIEGHGDGMMTRADMLKLHADLQAACQSVCDNGSDRAAALRQLQPQYPNAADIDWLVDTFIAGAVLREAPVTH